jgi:hypothetical protein
MSKTERGSVGKEDSLGNETPTTRVENGTIGQATLLLRTWTRIAVEQGATLQLRRKQWNRFEATMWFVNADEHEPITFAAATADSAMEGLESELCEDAANEMMEAGAV